MTRRLSVGDIAPAFTLPDARGGEMTLRYHGAPDADHDDPAGNARWIRDALDDLLATRNVRRPQTSPAECSTKWRVELLWWQGCPSHQRAADLLNSTLADLNWPVPGICLAGSTPVRRNHDHQARRQPVLLPGGVLPPHDVP